MITDKICLCGGYWDWVRENPQEDWSTRPSLIPFDLESPSKINGWVWSYICHENCEDNFASNEAKINHALSEIVLHFPGAATSSSSAPKKKCTICKTPQGSNPPHNWSCIFKSFDTDPTPFE